MRFYWPIAKVDAEQRMVWGYASTEAQDDQGETVTRQALSDALDDYMRFANIREMHQPSAVGIATEASVDERGLYLGARIVDDDAWQKVVAGVYKGFSIGGRVTARDAADRALITGLRLSEISVVDRPANPDAVFDCWKLAGDPSPDVASAMPPATPSAAAGAEQGKLVAEVRLARLMLGLDWLGGCVTADPGFMKDFADELSAIVTRLRACLDTLVGEAPLAAFSVTDSLRKSGRADLAAGLAKLAGEIVPRLDALQQRVEDIARAPLPPQTLARGFSAIAKREDAGGGAVTGADIVGVLARMTDEERTLTLIKAAHANPVLPTGWSPGVAAR